MNHNNARSYDITGWCVSFRSDTNDEEDLTDYIYDGKIYENPFDDICYHQQVQMFRRDPNPMDYAWTSFGDFCQQTETSPENVRLAFSVDHDNVKSNDLFRSTEIKHDWLMTTTPLTRNSITKFGLDYMASRTKAYQSRFVFHHDTMNLRRLDGDTVVVGSDKNSFFLGFVERFSFFDEDESSNNYTVQNPITKFDVHGLVTFMNSLHLTTTDVENGSPLLSMNARRFSVISKEYEYLK